MRFAKTRAARESGKAKSRVTMEIKYYINKYSNVLKMKSRNIGNGAFFRVLWCPTLKRKVVWKMFTSI